MYLRTLLILIVLGAVAIFAAINWKAFMAPTTLSVVFTTVEAPLGSYFARRRRSAHFVISTLRGLFAVLHPRGKPAQCARTASAAGTRRPSGSFPVSANSAHFWKASCVGSGKKPRNRRWSCWRNLKRLNASCARWSSSPEIRLPLTSGRLRIGLNVLPAGGFQRTLCERGSNYPRSTNNKFTLKNRFLLSVNVPGSFSGRLLHT